jgi:hypothetical protein
MNNLSLNERMQSEPAKLERCGSAVWVDKRPLTQKPGGLL